MYWLKIFLSLIVAISTPYAFSTPLTQPTEKENLDAIIELYQQSKTYDQLLNSLKGRLHETHISFLRNKIGSQASTKLPQLNRTGPTKISLSTTQAIVPIEIVNSREGQFLINNKMVNVTLSESPAELWQKIETSLPRHQAQNQLIDLLLPQAQAVIVEYVILVGIAAVAVVGAAANVTECFMIKLTSHTCNLGDHKNIQEAQKSYKEIEKMYVEVKGKFYLVCNDIIAGLKNCLDKFPAAAKQIRTETEQVHSSRKTSP